jgi:SAM-dependent methyltransferase
MNEVTVNLNEDSLYAEPDSKLYRIKRKLTYNTILRAIRKNAQGERHFSLLEIGTGSGFFMTFLESEFPSADINGLEYDPRLVTLTQSKVKKAKIVQGNAETFDLQREFDIIVSLQVIEHLYHPEKMLVAVKKHLKPGGVFVLTTPNLECLSARILRDKWHGFREDHVSLRSVSDWQSAVEKHGFETLYSGSTFFSGIPLLNKFPLGVLNWGLLYFVGSLRWNQGESFIGIFKNK